VGCDSGEVYYGFVDILYVDNKNVCSYADVDSDEFELEFISVISHVSLSLYNVTYKLLLI